jgi:hypothetical protein
MAYDLYTCSLLERKVFGQRENIPVIDCDFVGKATWTRSEYSLTTLEFTSFRNARVQGDSTSELSAQYEREGGFSLVFSLRLQNLGTFSDQRALQVLHHAHVNEIETSSKNVYKDLFMSRSWLRDVPFQCNF